jgi:hypothetical protein
MQLVKRHPFMSFWVFAAIVWTIMGIYGGIPKYQVVNGVECIQTSQNITCDWAGYETRKVGER